MFLGPILAEFESKNPNIELEVTYLPAVNSQDSTMMEERTAALTKARTELMSGDGADIYLFFNYASPDYEDYMLFPNPAQQIQGNAFHDLDFLFEHADFEEKEYISALKSAGEYEGKSYVISISYTTPALIGLAEPLKNSGFDENIASTSTNAYVEQLLKLSQEQCPYLSAASRHFLLKTPSLSPVFAEEASIQLNTEVWQEALQLNRHIVFPK